MSDEAHNELKKQIDAILMDDDDVDDLSDGYLEYQEKTQHQDNMPRQLWFWDRPLTHNATGPWDNRTCQHFASMWMDGDKCLWSGKCLLTGDLCRRLGPICPDLDTIVLACEHAPLLNMTMIVNNTTCLGCPFLAYNDEFFFCNRKILL